MTEQFVDRIIREKCVDTRKYRYIHCSDWCGEYIKRLPIEELDTMGAINGWKIVWTNEA